MINRIPYQCSIDSDILEKFSIALSLTKEDASDVIEKLMSQFISDSFAKASKAYSQLEPRNHISSEESTEDYAKANRKIPGWARKPQQTNHRIIRAFFELEEEFGTVTLQELAERCVNSEEYPDTFVSDFKGNFAQMKTDASNSHGKVFIVNDDTVEIWDEVSKVLMENKNLFLGGFDASMGRNKITHEQIELVYDYAKKVYLGQIGAPRASVEIARQSGMNASSAQRSIYVLKNMLDAKVYKSIMSEEQTRYFFAKILEDFGKEKLALAIEATEKHMKYRATKLYQNVPSIRDVVEEAKKNL